MPFNVLQQVDFYKTRNNGGTLKPLTDLANDVHKYCYTRPDEEDIEDLYLEAGAVGKERVIYYNGMGIFDSEQQALSPQGTTPICYPTAALRRNNIGWFTCTPTAGYSTSDNGEPFVTNIRDDIFAANSRNWFMRRLDNNNPIYSGTAFPGNVYLDVGNAAVRSKFKEVMDLWTWDDATENTTYYDAIFFDNWDTRFDAQTSAAIDTLQYGPDSNNAWFNAQLLALDDFYSYAQSKTGALGNPGKFYVNLQGHNRNASSFARWKLMNVKPSGAKRISGSMIEFWGLSSSGNYKSSTNVNYDIQAAEYILAHGVELWAVVQMSPTAIANANANINSADGQRATFALAAFLLVAQPTSYIRFGSEYGEYTPLDLFADIATLGAPLGPYALVGNDYTRSFEGGTVSLNAVNQTATINIIGGTAELPFVCEPIDRGTSIGADFEYQMVAQPFGAGPIVYSMSSVPGLSIDSDTGLITGSSTVAGTNEVTITFAETGGETVQRTFDLFTQGAAGVSELAVNAGGALYTDTETIDWEADPDNTTPHSTVAGDVNGSTVASVAPTPTADLSVDTHLNVTAALNALFRSWRLDNAAPWYIYRVPTTPGTKIVKMGWNSSTDASGRLYDVYINNVFMKTINPALYPDNTAFMRTYSNIEVAGSELTIECRRNVSSTGSARLSMYQVLEQTEGITYTAPVITFPDDLDEPTVEESPVSPLTIVVTTSNADGTTPVLQAFGVALQIGANFVDNLDGTGTFTWSPGYEDEGEYQVMFMASNANDIDLYDINTINIQVTKNNRLPTLDIPSEIEVSALTSTDVQLPGVDPDSEDTLSYAVSGSLSWTSIHDNGDGTFALRITPTLTEINVTPYTETITVDDGIDPVEVEIDITVTGYVSNNIIIRSYRRERENRGKLIL